MAVGSGKGRAALPCANEPPYNHLPHLQRTPHCTACCCRSISPSKLRVFQVLPRPQLALQLSLAGCSLCSLWAGASQGRSTLWAGACPWVVLCAQQRPILNTRDAPAPAGQLGGIPTRCGSVGLSQPQQHQASCKEKGEPMHCTHRATGAVHTLPSSTSMHYRCCSALILQLWDSS